MRASNAMRVSLKEIFLCILLLVCSVVSIRAQQPPVTVQVEVAKRAAGNPGATSVVADASNIVVWLSSLDRAAVSPAALNPGHGPQLVQRNKAFEPHILVVQVGTSVQFPNKDLFLHNLFSLFNAKRFDLGFYEAGSSKSVFFDRPGVSFLFCSIHEEMSATVVAVDTPYFGLSDRTGRIAIPNVPEGRYQMHVWYERGLPEDLKGLDRIVQVSSSTRSLDRIRVIQNSDFTLAHKDKYGQDYVPPPSAGYSGP
jgi:plastocyanin